LLSNKVLRLRAPEPEDLQIIYGWENDPSLWILSEVQVPLSKHILQEYIRSTNIDIYSAGQLRLMIEHKEKPFSVLGAIDIFDFDARNQKAGIGLLIDSKYREKGYASAALGITMNYCFEHLGLHQLYCNIQKNHIKSLNLFKRKGFEIIGLKKDWLRVGHHFEDVYLLQHIYSQQENSSV
jgi:diamine N-acetyltransferase